MTFSGSLNCIKTWWRQWTLRRYVFSLLAFFGTFNIYMLKVNMSIGIVAMTTDRFEASENGTIINIGPEYKWDNTIQGYVLSAFFYGYASTQILGGVLSKKYGGKLIFGGGIASSAALTLISPWLSDFSVYAFLVARVFMGIFEGIAGAASVTLLSKWLPPIERSRRVSQIISGCYFGTVFAMMFLGYLAKAGGWRSIFWFSGGFTLLWYIAWLYFIHESPEVDPKISKEELEYIQASLKDYKPAECHKIQWMGIFSSPPVWALNFAYFCEMWGFNTLLTLLPKFFKDVFDFDLSKSGILSALPYVAMGVMMHVSGQLGDRLVMKKWLTLTQTRKILTISGFLAQTGFIIGAVFWGNAGGTVFCLVMAVGLGALAVVVLNVNCLDIAPLHSPVVYGLCHTISTLPGGISPIIAGYIISTENPTLHEWRLVFYISAGLYFLGAAVFGIFGSGVRQSWDMIDADKVKGNKRSIKYKI